MYDDGSTVGMLAIASGKGGVGKTTTTLALATSLSRRGRPVRVVDTDYDMPDLHAMAGCEREPTLATVLAGNPPPDLVSAEYPGVRVVPAPPAEIGSSVADALAALATADDRLTIVDTPAGAGPGAVTPLRSADAVLLVTDTSPQSLWDTAKTAAMARELGVTCCGVVLTCSTRVPDGIGEFLAAPVLGAIPSARRPLADEAVWQAYERITARLFRHTVI
ncbi:MinD/ParA family ATP-binding protein [Haloarchaeobius sp. TZWWS8]|uniref:MinD/ParA family ATP-binding protein n=1 Tax=Haloarchaeobius sp. TZWWS8 TaxID=3446121 RepID=UPI003EB8C8E8